MRTLYLLWRKLYLLDAKIECMKWMMLVDMRAKMHNAGFCMHCTI